jgi:hypothetical protein
MNIVSAFPVNIEQTAVILMTVEKGAVLIGQQDTPELWQKLQDWLAAGNAIPAYNPPPPPPVEVARETILLRMTDAEAALLENALANASPRTRLLWSSTDTYRSDTPLWPPIEAMAKHLYGDARAVELLAPSA